jgi:hypothetical protein
MSLPGEELPDPKDMVGVWRKMSRAKAMLVPAPGRDPLGAFALLEEVLDENPANRDVLSHYAEVHEPARSAQGVPALEDRCRRALESGGR